MFARLSLAAVVVLVLPLVAATSCPPPGALRACDVLYSGPDVRAGLVVVVVHPVCDPVPQAHVMRSTLETAVGGTWVPVGRVNVTNTVPDAIGFEIELTEACREGTFRARVHVEGAGPDGSPYMFDDTSPERTFALIECAG